MSNVLLEASEGSLSLKATDIKVSFQTIIPVDAVEFGAVTVFCDKLSGILATIPDGEISIEQDDNKVVIKPTFKKVRFQLKTISSEKFPWTSRCAERVVLRYSLQRIQRNGISNTFCSIGWWDKVLHEWRLHRESSGRPYIGCNGWSSAFLYKKGIWCADSWL